MPSVEITPGRSSIFPKMIPWGASLVEEVINIIKDEDLISKAESKGARFLEILHVS